MKKQILNYIKIAMLLVLFLQAGRASAQSWITWNAATNASTLTGSYSGGTVTVTITGTGTTPDLTSPQDSGQTAAYWGLSSTVADNTFKLRNSQYTSQSPMKTITFTFSTPVKISDFNIGGLETQAGSFFDGFSFSGITFGGFVTDANATATSSTVSAIGLTSGNVHFTNSTTTVSSFTMSSVPKGTLYTATTFFEIAVSPPCNAGTTAPALNALTLPNVCPANTVNLNGLLSSSATAAQAMMLKWFTDAAHTTPVADATQAAAGTYYAFYYDATNNCYSPATGPVTATVAACCPTTSPTVN